MADLFEMLRSCGAAARSSRNKISQLLGIKQFPLSLLVHQPFLFYRWAQVDGFFLQKKSPIEFYTN